jgi:hypothetical protein
MGNNSFIFTGRENKLRLKANNLALFAHLAKGIDDDTWLFHLQRDDYKRWFKDSIHDDTLAEIAEEAKKLYPDPKKSRKMILDHINKEYMV